MTRVFQVLAIILFGLIFLALTWFSQNTTSAKSYNASMCATWGYAPDCHTPLEK